MLHYLIKLFLPSNWLRLIVAFTLLLPLIFGGKQEAEAKEKLEIVLKNINTIDVCGDKSKKQIIITVDLGYIAFADSLFAFNFELNYNQNKIKLHSALYLNTLSEFFDFKEVGFDKGLVKGTLAVNFSAPQVAGNKPLIAFLGDYLLDCPDTTFVNVSYFEFTDEFQKEITGYKSALVEGTVVSKPDRILKTAFDRNLINNFDEDSLQKLKIRYSYGGKNKIKNLVLNIETDKEDLFEIKDVRSLTEKIVVDTLIRESGKLIVRSQVLDSINSLDAFEIDILEKMKRTDTAKLSIKTNIVDSCSCIVQILDTNAVLTSYKKEDTLNVIDFEPQKRNDIKIVQNELDIENAEGQIKNISVYSVQGQLVMKQESDGSSRQKLKLDLLNNGFYIVIIDLNKEYKKLILIKN